MSHPVHPRVLPLTLIGIFLVMLFPWTESSVRAQTLTPQKVQEMTDYGAKVADAERRMQEIDKELSKPNLDQATKDKLARDKADADRSRQANQNSVETLEGKGSDAHKLFEKARDARRKQHELEDAKKAAENAQGDDKKKADRRVNRVRLEFEDAKKGIGTLPSLPQPYSVIASAGGAAITGTVAYALLDECKKHLLLSSIDSILPARISANGHQSARNPFLHLVQLPGNTGTPAPKPPAGQSSGTAPAASSGGTPSASRLQKLHNDGQKLGSANFNEASIGGGKTGPFHKDILRSKLDDYLKQQGSQFSDVEKDVFREAYWLGEKAESDSAGMTHIDPPRLETPNASPTVTLEGKATVPGPGTIQLTAESGTSFFADVDKNGNYGVVVPREFQPVKMTLRTNALTAAWQYNEKSGSWTQTTGTTNPAGSAPTGATHSTPSGATGTSGQSSVPAQPNTQPSAQTKPDGKTSQGTTGAMAPTLLPKGTVQQVNWSMVGKVEYARPIKKGGTTSRTTEDIGDATATQITFEFEGKDENIDSLCGGIGLAWNRFDSLSPRIDYLKQDDVYSIGGKLTWMDLQYQQKLFTGLKINAAYKNDDDGQSFGMTEVNIPEIPLVPDMPSSSIGSPGTSPMEERTYNIPTGNILIDNRPQFIKRFTPNTDIWQVSRNLEGAGLPGVDTWTAWRSNPLGNDMFVYYLDDLSQLKLFTNIAGSRIDLVEPNEDRKGAPAPSLNPMYWPKNQAEALPQWTLHLSRIGER